MPRGAPAPPILDAAMFAFLVDLEVRKSARLRYPVSLLVLRTEVEGQTAEPCELGARLARVVASVVRATDAIRRPTREESLAALLVDAAWEHVPAIGERIVDEVSGHRFRIGTSDAAVTLHVGGACFPTTASSGDELLAQADARAHEPNPARPPF